VRALIADASKEYKIVTMMGSNDFANQLLIFPASSDMTISETVKPKTVGNRPEPYFSLQRRHPFK
jgi:hypothetical protein